FWSITVLRPAALMTCCCSTGSSKSLAKGDSSARALDEEREQAPIIANAAAHTLRRERMPGYSRAFIGSNRHYSVQRHCQIYSFELTPVPRCLRPSPCENVTVNNSRMR